MLQVHSLRAPMLSSGSEVPVGTGRLESEDAVTENLKRILMVGVPLIAVAGVWNLLTR